MAKQLFTNNATSTLSGTLAQGGVTLICASGEGSNFPAPTGSDFFLLTIFERDLSSNEEFIEVVKVTARTADTMTIERDVESMTGNAGGYAYPSVPAKTVYLELRWTAMGAGNLLQESDTGTPTAKGKELLTAADAAAVRTAAALGDSATKNVGTGAGTVAAGDHTHAGYATTGANTFTGDQTLGAGAKLVFEGTTDNAYETTVDPGDPTADRTLTLPNKSGTLATTDERLLSKAVTFTRDLTTATGTQAVTGVGFTPTAIVFVYAISGTAQEGVGFSDSSKAGRNRNYLSPTGWFVGAQAISASVSSGNYQIGDVSTYDSDGFTISWTKSGSPTGTLTVYALCFR